LIRVATFRYPSFVNGNYRNFPHHRRPSPPCKIVNRNATHACGHARSLRLTPARDTLPGRLLSEGKKTWLAFTRSDRLRSPSSLAVSMIGSANYKKIFSSGPCQAATYQLDCDVQADKSFGRPWYGEGSLLTGEGRIAYFDGRQGAARLAEKSQRFRFSGASEPMHLCLVCLSDGEPSWRRTPPLRGEACLRLCRTEPPSPSAQWINEYKGRGLPVGLLASLQTAEHGANPQAAVSGALRAHPARECRAPTTQPSHELCRCPPASPRRSCSRRSALQAG